MLSPIVSNSPAALLPSAASDSMTDGNESLLLRQDPATAGSLKNFDTKIRSLDGEPSSMRNKQRWKPIVVVTFTCFVVAVLVVWTFRGTVTTCEETDLTPPSNITMIETSPSRTRLAWTPSSTTCECQVVYDVKVCVTYESCAAGRSSQHCTRHPTQDAGFDFDSTVGTSYCVQVTACALCRDKVVRSQPAFKEIVTPLYAPGDFEVTATAIGPESVQLVVFVPQVKNGALDRCYITLNGIDGGRSFSCNNHGGNASIVAINELEQGTDYTISVTFANMHGGWEIGTRKVISVTTTAAALNDDIEKTEETSYAVFVIILFIAWLIKTMSEQPRRRRNRRRRW